MPAQRGRARLVDEWPRVSVVIPALNEARNLTELLPEVPAVHEVILVDGGSVDDTVDTARRIMPDIQVVQQTRRGKGNALVCGMHAATGDIAILLDADGSADPAEIPRFVAALTRGADFAKGSRFLDGGGSDDLTRLRRLGNGTLTTIVNVLLGLRYTDLCYGYNAFWLDVLKRLELPDPVGAAPVWGDGFEIETLVNCRVAAAGLVVEEVPSMEKVRLFGTSNLNAVTDGVRVLRTIFRERRLAPAPASRVAGLRPDEPLPVEAEAAPGGAALSGELAS